MAQIVSIQVGLPKLLGVEGAANPMDCPWTTGFSKNLSQVQFGWDKIT